VENKLAAPSGCSTINLQLHPVAVVRSKASSLPVYQFKNYLNNTENNLFHVKEVSPVFGY